MNGRSPVIALLGAAALVVTACASPDGDVAGTGDDATTSSAPTAVPSTGPPDGAAGPTSTPDGPEVPLPVAQGSDVDGLVDVGGHRLDVFCTGSGEPTVVILHGWIDQPGLKSSHFYGPLVDELGGELRTCYYDRVNVGDSDDLPGTQTPEMVVEDLDNPMTALGEPGPFLLIGQSAGGMVASAYAVAHPDEVAGIVMVDAAFDEEIIIEDVGMVPEGASPCDPENRRADGEESLQKIDNCAMYRWAYERREQRPAVPLVYLAAEREKWSTFSEFGPAWTGAIIPLQQAYAESWSPGKFEWVDSGHDIHVEKPEAVADAVRWVVEHRSG